MKFWYLLSFLIYKKVESVCNPGFQSSLVYPTVCVSISVCWKLGPIHAVTSQNINNTIHLKEKNLSILSPWDFESGLDTIDPNWFYPDKYFCRNTSYLGAIYDSSKSKVLKMVEMKNEKKFTNKKPDATPYFCKRNFSQMHHIDFICTLLSVPSLSVGQIHTACVRPRFEI